MKQKRSKGTVTLDEFIKDLDKMPRGKFKPFAYHNVLGDMIEVFWSNESHFAQWLNREITLLVSQKDKKTVVGVIVEGLSKITKTPPPFDRTMLVTAITTRQHKMLLQSASKEKKSVHDIVGGALDMYLSRKKTNDERRSP